MNFLLYFIKLSKLRPYVSGNIDAAGLFFHTMFWSRLAYLMPKTEIFSLCRFISKNKLEIIEIFADFYQIDKIETPFLQNYWWAGLFFHTLFWNSLGYLMPKKFSEILFAADLLPKIIWKSLIFFTDFVLL